jgi:hypothetical protein
MESDDISHKYSNDQSNSWRSNKKRTIDSFDFVEEDEISGSFGDASERDLGAKKKKSKISHKGTKSKKPKRKKTD